MKSYLQSTGENLKFAHLPNQKASLLIKNLDKQIWKDPGKLVTLTWCLVFNLATRSCRSYCHCWTHVFIAWWCRAGRCVACCRLRPRAAPCPALSARSTAPGPRGSCPLWRLGSPGCPHRGGAPPTPPTVWWLDSAQENLFVFRLKYFLSLFNPTSCWWFLAH